MFSIDGMAIDTMALNGDFNLPKTVSTQSTGFSNRTPAYQRLLIEFFALVVVLSVFANFLLILIVLKFKNFRKNSTYQILLHLNLLQALLSFGTPVMLFPFFSAAGFHASYPDPELKCYLYEMEFAVLLGVYLLLILLIIDWYLQVYCEETHKKFGKFNKFLLGLVYCFLIIFPSITIGKGCCTPKVIQASRSFISLTAVLTGLASAVMIVLMIIVNIIHQFKARGLQTNPAKNIGLITTNLFVFMLVPILAVLLLADIAKIFLTAGLIIVCTLFFTTPIFNLLCLRWRDANFAVAIKAILNCQCNPRYVMMNQNNSDNTNDLV